MILQYTGQGGDVALIDVGFGGNNARRLVLCYEVGKYGSWLGFCILSPIALSKFVDRFDEKCRHRQISTSLVAVCLLNWE